VGYTGTIVVGRSAGLLVHEDGMSGFGYRHQRLRALGDGWQLVETGGWLEAPELPGPCLRLAASTKSPVLAAHVFDSDWAQLCTAVGDRAAPVTVLHEMDERFADDHEPGCRPGPSNRTVDDVVSELLQWSAVAGLHADPSTVHQAVTEDQLADDIIFAIVRALGVTRIGRPLPRAFPVDSWPFSSVSSSAYVARMWAAGRENDDAAAPWEHASIALDQEIWAAAYRPGTDVASLAQQAIDINAARTRARHHRDPGQDDLELLVTLLNEGRLNPEQEIADGYDRRAT
jgi:hypothetical protein